MSPSEFANDDLIKIFLGETEELLQELDSEFIKTEELIRGGSAPEQESLEAMFRAVHTIKGGAAMFDFNAMKDLAHALEHILDGLRKSTLSFDAACLETLFDGADALKQAAGAVNLPDQGAADVRAATARICRYVDARQGDGGEMLGGAASAELSEYARERIAEAKEEGLHPISLQLRWGIELRLGSLRTETLTRALGEGEILDIKPQIDSLPEMSAMDPASTDLTVSVLALTDLTNDEIATTLGIGSSAITTVQTEVQEQDSGETEEAEGGASFSEHVVRVDITRLDDLMDLTGEIVTSRTRLDDLVASLKGRDTKDPLTESFAQSAKDMGALIDLLQEHVIGLRMIPVRQLFSKFPRTVRDLGRRSGKEIRLVYEGEDTEFDKRLIEQIDNPVMHMVRNACDHGIETPEERESAGKPSLGTITLAASHESNHIVVEVRDDGRGLDMLAIWEKAVAQGLIASEQELDEGILADLIMTSGFSTAKEVTDISGRGIGLDVVRKKIAELGGSVRLSSEHGVGTTISMRLPMTLAILPSLLVEEGDRVFAVPLAAVSEVLRVRGADIRRIRGMSVMDMRGETLPVARLADILGIDDEDWATDRKGFVVVVNAAGQQLGIGVDRLRGQQQIVVKNLEEAVGRTAGIGGATILGDGTVVPIIDIDGAVSLVVQKTGAHTTAGGEGA